MVYKFTRKAISDLESILFYISIDLCNEKAVKDLLNEIESTLLRICDFPKIFPEVINPYIDKNGIRKGLVKNYIMYYLIDDEEIIVLRIVYAKRNLEDVLKELSKR